MPTGRTKETPTTTAEDSQARHKNAEVLRWFKVSPPARLEKILTAIQTNNIVRDSKEQVKRERPAQADGKTVQHAAKAWARPPVAPCRERKAMRGPVDQCLAKLAIAWQRMVNSKSSERKEATRSHTWPKLSSLAPPEEWKLPQGTKESEATR